MGKVNKAKALKQKIAKRVEAAKKEVTAISSKVTFKAKERYSDQKLLLATTPTVTPPKKHKNKREKFRLKHKNLINKFMQQRKVRKEEIARKNREKTAVVGDMRKLKDALPSLDDLFKLKRENQIKTGMEETPESTNKPSVKEKIRNKKKKFIDRVNAFQKCLSDPDFKTNPRDVISYHIQYTNGLTE